MNSLPKYVDEGMETCRFIVSPASGITWLRII